MVPTAVTLPLQRTSPIVPYSSLVTLFTRTLTPTSDKCFCLAAKRAGPERNIRARSVRSLEHCAIPTMRRTSFRDRSIVRSTFSCELSPRKLLCSRNDHCSMHSEIE